MALATTVHKRLNDQPDRDYFLHLEEEAVLRRLDAVEANPLLESAL